ncbi:MAG: murein biosynthesis integral membrane protein MurJ [Candidatus Pacebacteria bacterium]|nr:murein biosynthesis integral membrane protein MurJ [Candidatus Paceibacterota bacterium]MDD5621009.1 murein biosynthesis integral membrane protein MurJ [Candidatus Paceibacterota bacterium]
MIKKVLGKTSKSITSAAIILSISSIASGLLGFLRDRLLAGKFGASQELDIYYAAFRIPNLVFAILISGGIIAAFMPIFSEHYIKEERKAWDLTNNLLNVFLVFSIIICGLLFIFTPQLIKLIVPGFTPDNMAQAVGLTRILFLSPIFFGISNIFSSILQYFNRFISFAIAPIFYNLGIIFGIFFFLPIFGLKGLAFGVVLGAFLHWFVQLPSAITSGFRYRPIFNLKSQGLRKIFWLMIPRTFSAIASHFNLIIVTSIASLIGVGNISIFSFSENLRSFPISIIGGSFAVAAYPFLARFWAKGEKDKFYQSFSSTFRQTLFFVIPISLALFLLRGPVVRIVLGTGKFDWIDTRLTAACLGLFSLGIFTYTLIPFFQRMFFAVKDTKTPFFNSAMALGINVGLAWLLTWAFSFSNFFSKFFAGLLSLEDIPSIGVIGLPLSITITGLLQFVFLLYLLTRKVKNLPLDEVWESAKKILIASFVMVGIMYICMSLIGESINVLTARGVLIQAIITTVAGIAVFLFMGIALRIKELKIFLHTIGLKYGKKN